MKFFACFLATALISCGVEGDEMAAHNLRVDSVELREALAGCLIRLSVPQNLVDGVYVLVEFDTVEYDLGAGWNTGTYTYTIFQPGYYQIVAKVAFYHVEGQEFKAIKINRTGGTHSTIASNQGYSAITGDGIIGVTSPISFYDVGDTIKIYARHGGHPNRNIFEAITSSFVHIQQIM